jgi:hypothetical protein
MLVAPVVTKSSAVSVSSLPAVAGADYVAIFPSVVPLSKKNAAARAGVAGSRLINAAEMANFIYVMTSLS